MARMKQIKIEHPANIEPRLALSLVGRVIDQGKISQHMRGGVTVKHYTWITTIRLAGTGALPLEYTVEVRPKGNTTAADSFVVRRIEPNA